MHERATGLVLRTYPLTETSLIVHWLTAERGRLATVAKGARRTKSPFRGKLDLFYLADFSFRRSARSDLHTLNEVVLRQSHEALRRDLAKLQQVSYAAALIEQTTEKETPLPEAFALLLNLLAHLLTHPARPRLVLAFELQWLRHLGLEPSMAASKLSEPARQLVRALLQPDWAAVEALQASAQHVQEVKRFLNSFMIYHLERIPHGRQKALAAVSRQ